MSVAASPNPVMKMSMMMIFRTIRVPKVEAQLWLGSLVYIEMSLYRREV